VSLVGRNFSGQIENSFWWSKNRDKILKVVRASEKVENRWSTPVPLKVSPGVTTLPLPNSEAMALTDLTREGDRQRG